MKILFKYFKLYIALFKTSLIADMEYRMNFVTRIAIDIFWYVAQILTFEVLFMHTKTIGDWNVYQSRVFLGILFVADSIFMIIFHDNLDNFSEKVRKGDLDLLLAKPINSQFLISLQKATTANFGNLLMGLGWLTWSLSQLDNLVPARILWLLILIPIGCLIQYCMKFFFATSACIFAKSDNLHFLWYQVYRLGMRPDSMYFPWLRWLILSVVPVGFIASVPANAVFGLASTTLILWSIVLTSGLLYSTHLFWNFALKHYSSASS